MRAIISKKFEKMPKVKNPITNEMMQLYKCRICGKKVMRKERLSHYNTHRFLQGDKK